MMAHAKVSDEKLFDGLITVFRTHGFEGATMSKLVEATGLERASLYHRFPGGKTEMACAVLEQAGQRFNATILAPLAEPGDPATRIAKMAKRTKEFYDGGRLSCLIDTMSVGGEKEEIKRCVAQTFKAWFDALYKISMEAGIGAKEAKQRAEDAMTSIQGALVMNRALNLTRPFARVMEDLPRMLTQKR
ncbi:MAG: TetR family transcriptional regulator [Phycisphaerae bacterium]|nr:MAG: TetR family transcriptional regulator [Phycisphaerae bacterium]